MWLVHATPVNEWKQNVARKEWEKRCAPTKCGVVVEQLRIPVRHVSVSTDYQRVMSHMQVISVTRVDECEQNVARNECEHHVHATFCSHKMSSIKCGMIVKQLCIPVSHVSVWMSRVACMGELCDTLKWVGAKLYCCVLQWVVSSRMNESCHTYEWVVSFVWMCHVTHVNHSVHTCEWVMAHVPMRHDAHVDESCHTREWLMSHM